MPDKRPRPGDIEIESISLINFDNQESWDIRHLCLEFNIYESVATDHIRADFLISDALSLQSEMPLIGEEKIGVKFRTPAVEPGAYTYRYIDLQFSVVKLEHLEETQDRAAHYVLIAVDPLVIADSLTTFARAYGPEPVSSMVQSIGQEFLKLSGNKFEVETSFGVSQIMIPMLSPFEAMHFLASEARAQPTGGGDVSPSNFVFFQNADGHKWMTLDKLMRTLNSDRGISWKLWVTEQSLTGAPQIESPNAPTPNDDSPDDIEGFQRNPLEFFYITHIRMNKTFDVEKGLKAGLYDNRVDFVDPVLQVNDSVQLGTLKDGGARKWQTYYNPEDDDDFDKYTKISGTNQQGFALASEFNPYIGSGTAHIRFLVTNKHQDASFQVIPRARQDFLPLLVSSKEQLDYNVFEVTVPGDSDARAGSVIDFINLHRFGATDDIKFKLHQYLSGKWFVTSVRHKYTFNQGYHTIMQVVKNSYESEIKNEKP